MRRRSGVLVHVALLFALAVALFPSNAIAAQGAPPKGKAPKAAKTDSAKKSKKATTDTTPKVAKLPNSPLFRSQSLMEVTFTTNIKAIRKDKGDKAPWHAATLSYSDTSSQSGTRVVPVRARTRGIWRLKNCDFPPIRLNFVNKAAKGSVFHDLDEPKLVGYCKGMSNYEQYILQEFQLYRIYRLLTPVSHQVRLLRMTYVDSATAKVEATKYAFIVEDPAHVAAAVNGKIMKVLGATSDDLDGEQATLAYLFQYMIGNTDFSFGGLHNAELVALPTGTNMPIAYDFDFAGAIDASYATPDTSLRITRVRDRQYRGFCQQNPLVPKVLQHFRDKKAAIYALYSDQLGALMAPRTVKETLEYFDAFYATIADPKEVDRRILRDCRNPR